MDAEHVDDENRLAHEQAHESWKAQQDERDLHKVVEGIRGGWRRKRRHLSHEALAIDVGFIVVVSQGLPTSSIASRPQSEVSCDKSAEHDRMMEHWTMREREEL